MLMKHLQKNTMQRPDQNACNMSREELLVARSYCNDRNKKRNARCNIRKKTNATSHIVLRQHLMQWYCNMIKLNMKHEKMKTTQ
jgi:hypothetical protein